MTLGRNTPSFPEAVAMPRRGRQAVLRRLEEVSRELGADHVEHLDTRSLGDYVVASFRLRGRGQTGAWLGFQAEIKVFVEAKHALE